VGASCSTSCGPAGAGEGARRFVPLRDPLAFACRGGGASTNTSGSFPFAGRRVRTGRDEVGNGGAGSSVGEGSGSAMLTAETWHASNKDMKMICAPSSAGGAASGGRFHQIWLGPISPKYVSRDGELISGCHFGFWAACCWHS
jgi:hypothetical protein